MHRFIRRLAILAAAAALGTAGVTTAAYASGGDPGPSGSGGGSSGGGSSGGGSSGGGGGGSGSIANPVICGSVGVGVDGIAGYYGDQGVFVGSTFENCGNVKTIYYAVFTDLNPNPSCAYTIPSMGTKSISPTSSQSFSPGLEATPPNFGVCPMPASETFRVDLYAQPNIFLRSYTWTFNPSSGATISFG